MTQTFHPLPNSEYCTSCGRHRHQHGPAQECPVVNLDTIKENVRYDKSQDWVVNSAAAVANDHLTGTASPSPAGETVNHPAHYGGDTPYETIKVLKVWLPREQYLGFLRGNAIKYHSRLGKKGHADEDAAKAAWYARELEKELNQ